MAIAIKDLKDERALLLERLREIEVDQRRVEAEMKLVRQREIRTKRELEALTTLLEIAEPAAEESKD